MDHVARSGTVIEAVENQPWSGEAVVHVSIANWIKTQDERLVPAKRKLWFKIEAEQGRSHDSISKDYELDVRVCEEINSALSCEADVSKAKILRYLKGHGVVCQGVTPGNDGFVLSKTESESLIAHDPASKTVIFPYLIGRELLSEAGFPKRDIIDFGRMNILEAQGFSAAFSHLKKTVLPELENKAKEEHESEDAHKEHLNTWWMHWRARTELIEAISRTNRYLVCSRVTKRPIFVFVAKEVRPGDALQCFAFEDDYTFGILQSHLHWLWFITKCSKLKADFRYTPPSVFGTFPWPQNPAVKQINAVAEAGLEVRRVRAEGLKKMKGGLRALYRTLELPGANPLKDAHAALDEAVMAAYGFSPKKDLLGQLLALNLEVAARIERGEEVTAPGVPKSYKDPKKLVTEDCIRPTEG